jgi:CMP-N-acetylneuraminic acid synthetase
MCRVIGVIPARGGSKGVPKKNLQEVGGIPLIARSVLSAKGSRLSDVFVYTDDENIMQIALDAGARGIMRPDDVSGDVITSEDTIKRFLSDSFPNDSASVMLIQCTTPFMKAEYIDQALDLFSNKKFNLDSVVSTTHLGRYIGYDSRTEDYQEWLPFYPKRWRRQDYIPPYYIENGGFYLATRSLWDSGKRMGRRIGQVLMSWWESIEIDDPDDLEVCRRLASMFDSNNGKPFGVK